MAKKNSGELREERKLKLDEAAAIVDLTEKEDRDMTADEVKKFDTINDEVEVLNGKIERAAKAEKLLAQRVALESRGGQRGTDTVVGSTILGKSEEKEKGKIVKRYSFQEVVRHLAAKKGISSLDGLALEMHQEANKEAREVGIAYDLNTVNLPSFFMDARSSEQRAVTVSAQGANTVATDLSSDVIPLLRPDLQLVNMGARVLSNLVGDVDIPIHSSGSTAYWEDEEDEVPLSQVGTDKLTISPTRLTASTEVTEKMLRQNSVGIEMLIREDIQDSIAHKLEETSYNGDGVSTPRGILNYNDISVVSIGTNGGAITRDHLVDLTTEIADANISTNGGFFVSTPRVKGKLQKTEVSANTAVFVWGDNNNNMLIGHNARTSSHIPSNLTKGSGTDLNAMLFGVFRNLLYGQWGGLSLKVDDITQARRAKTILTVYTYWDMVLRYAKAFAAAKDIDLTA